MRKFYLLSTIVLLLLCGLSSKAQDFSNKGKEFWFCFPNHIPSGNNPGSMSLWITSDRATSGTISMSNGTFNATFNIPANGIQSINIPYNLAHISNAESGTVIQKSIKVIADPGKPAFVAYAQQYGNARSAATLLLPTNVLGKKYRAVSFTHSATSSNGQNSRAQFQVIATKPNTNVQITPYANGVAGSVFNISLPNVGDMYQYQATADITGTFIESVAIGNNGCNPIAVFSGNSAVTIGTTFCNGNSYDPLFQQNYPVSTWGKSYGLIPFGDYTNGNPYRIMAAENNTNVSINGSVVATLNAGQIYPNSFNSNPVTITQPSLITGDKPICVIEYAQTSACSGTNNGDPDMVILNPFEQTVKDITIFSSTQQNINRQWLNVLIKTVAVPSFRIDGFVPSTAFQPATNIPGYSYLQHQFNPAIQGSHRLQADSGFNAICYGFQQGNFESYAYSAGTNVKDLYQQIGVTSQYGIEPTPSVCKGSPFRFKVSLPYCADSIRWDLSQLPGPPTAPPTQIYNTCAAVLGGPDSTTVVNGKTLYWYSLPTLYTFNVSGTFPVQIEVYAPNTDGCGNLQEIEFDLSVFDPPVADFNFITSGCVAEPVQFQDNTTTPRPSYIWNWNFDDPGSGAANTSGLQNPTHIFSAPGTYNVKFSTITTPGCISSEIIKPVTVAPLPTATITGATTVCVNDPEPTVTFTASGGTAPYTFSYHINAGPAIHTNSPTATLTVNVPTGTAGTFTYHLDSVKNTGSTLCVTAYTNSSVDVVVNANTGLALTFGSSTQSLCQNVAISDITYTISGGGNNATVTGLPPGVNGVYNAGTFIISGTPTTPGTYNYSVTATGLCLPNTLTGTITVNPDADIALNSGNNIQAVCESTPIANILYNITGGGTGATVSGLPAGVTGSYSGGVFTIQGSPTVIGTFNYTVTTTGTCLQKTATGTITVNPDAVLTLTSGVPSTNQNLCENVAITNITYNISGGGTGGTVSGLPPGINGVYAGGVFTISGSPTTPGIYTYTVTTTGTCLQKTATGTITVNPDAAIALTSAPPTNAQELCVNSSITNITYSITGGGTGGTVSGLPAGVTGVYGGNVFTISGTPTVSGTFNYTVTTTGTCVQKTATGTIIVNALPTSNFSFTTPSCETRTINFTDLSVPNSGSNVTWTWTFGDASPPVTINAPASPNTSHTYATANTYNVSLVVTTDKGCVSTAPARPVTINLKPQTEFTVPEVCINDVATVFPDNSTIAAPGTIDPTGYYWDFGDPASGPANTSTTRNGTHLYTAIGPYNVMHVSTSSAGCKDTVYHTIFINAADPNADFTIPAPTTMCSNDSVTIINRSTISQGSVTKLDIYWDVAGAPGTFETINDPVFNAPYRHKYPTLTTTQTYTIRMVAYSGAICFANRTQTVTVNASPRTQFVAMPNVCFDAAPFQITQATETGGVPGAPTYSGPGVSPSGLFTPSAVVPGSTNTIKYLYVSTAGGCRDSATQTIHVYDTASARFTYSPLNCEKQAVTFNSTTSTVPASAGAITGWTWNFGDPASGAANTSSLQNPSHTFTSWGNYTVTLSVTTSNNCRSTVSSSTIFVNPIPRPNFTVPASVCLPAATIAFNSSASSIPDGTQGSFTYLWNFGDPASGPLNTATGSSPSHIYNSVGPFNVNLQITSGAGCVHDTTIVVNNIHPQPLGSFTVDKTEICVGGGSFTFTDNSNPMDGTTTQWNWNMDDGNTRTTRVVNYTFANARTYNVTLYTVNSHGCRSTSFTLPITVHPYPVVDAGPDRVLLEGGQITMDPTVTGSGLTYLWTPTPTGVFAGSNIIRNPAINGIDDILLTLTVTGVGGCKSTDQVFIKVLKFPSIPNIFSPNGDGVHDRWVIDYLNTYPGSTVDIYNRYGQLIFHSDGYATPWDGTVGGKPVPVGTYYYIVNPKNGRKIMSGYVDVIR